MKINHRKHITKRGIIKRNPRNVPYQTIGKMALIKNIQKTSFPENRSEWTQAHNDAKYYRKMLKKYPQLRKKGFSKEDIRYD